MVFRGIYGVRAADTGRPVHHLVGFRSLHLEAGARERTDVSCSMRPLQHWGRGGFVIAHDALAVLACSYAGDPAYAEATLTMPHESRPRPAPPDR